jgi:hypothetical protein
MPKKDVISDSDDKPPKNNCPECDEFDPRSVERVGMCTKCYSAKQPLIKVDNHYVEWSYHHYGDTGEKTLDAHKEDLNAYLPHIEWCNIRGKFKVSFTAADTGGYDVINIVWYFDSTEDILKAMGI